MWNALKIFYCRSQAHLKCTEKFFAHSKKIVYYICLPSFVNFSSSFEFRVETIQKFRFDEDKFKCKNFFFVDQLEFLHKLEIFQHIQLNRISPRSFFSVRTIRKNYLENRKKNTLCFMNEDADEQKSVFRKKKSNKHRENEFKNLRQWNV